MKNKFEGESKRKSGYKIVKYCGVCGREFSSESIRCPEDGRVCCNRCFRKYEDEERNIKQFLCKLCYFTKQEERRMQRRENLFRSAGNILAFIGLAILLWLVLRWL